ncbi:hypothetical protein FOZ60_010586 [Perkinsus olseni]|uniref:Uncharacterized protein n=1 Tax=Perkinsus olseni TaxID=32597 RepID=A0A7J6NEV5_PEROL|nr:hypothetical protein FOZ60_010586 [Perkinsus olseni]
MRADSDYGRRSSPSSRKATATRSHRGSPSPSRSHLLSAAGLSSSKNTTHSPLSRSWAAGQPSRRTASSEVERSIAELSLKCQQLTGQLERLAKNFAREVDERRGTEDKLTRHVQQQVEELVNIVRESEAKTEQDVGQALKVLRSNLSLQMTEASGRHLQKLEKKLSDEFNKVVEGCSADFGERLSKEGAEINQRVFRIEALLRRSTERFTDALDPMRATLADLSSRFEEVESKAMLGQPGEGQMSPSRLKQQILAHVEGRLRKFESESLDKIANHRERSPPRECDVEMKLKLQQIERKLAASNPDVRLASMRSETQDSLNAVNQRIDTLQGELESFRGETSDAINSQTQRLKDHVLGEVKKNAAEAQRREQELSRSLEASINSVSDSHDELKKSLETDFRSAVDNVRNDSEKSKADSRGLSDQVGRIQRELNSLTTQRAELDKTVAEFKEKVNVMSANSSKFITEQITELEKRTTGSLAESRSSIMRGFESDLMRITEELDCHVKSVQSSTEERMRSQIEFVKAEIDSKSAETADRLRRMMGSLIELNMRVEKQEDMMSDPKLQRHIRGSVLTLADEFRDVTRPASVRRHRGFGRVLRLDGLR